MWKRRVRYGSRAQDAFPYLVEELRFAARFYERLRFESAPFSDRDLLRGLLYWCKQRFGRWDYPRELVRHFRDTRDSWPSVAPQPTVGGGEQRPDKQVVRLFGLGDIMWLPKPDADYIGPALAQLLSRADLIFGNLETPITRARAHAARGRIVCFNSDQALIAPLAAFARRCPVVLNVANNHALDAGPDGLRDTLELLAESGILSVGVATSEQPASVLIPVRGIQVSCLGFCGFVNPRPAAPLRHGEGGVTLNVVPDLVARSSALQLGQIISAVEQVRRRGAELTLLGLHWGYEHEFLPDPRQMVIARALVNAGVSAIFGHHSHVAQPIEYLTLLAGRDGISGARPVVYSLGNFISRMVGRDFWFGQIAELVVERSQPADLAQGSSSDGNSELGYVHLRHCHLHPLLTYRAGDRYHVELLSTLLGEPLTHPGRRRAERCQELWQKIRTQ